MKTLRQALPMMNALLVFESAARLGNFTRAAEELHISQSAVSRHVSNLEHQTGLVLFKRTGNRVSLTNEGKYVSDATSAGLGQIRDVIDALKPPSHQTLTIACSHTIGNFWLIPRLDRLRSAIPSHQVRLLAADSYSDFDDPEVDLSIRYGDETSWPGMIKRKLFDEKIFPVCAPSLVQRYPIVRRDIGAAGRNAPLLRLEPKVGGGGFFDWREWFQNKQGSDGVLGLALSNYALMIEEAIAGRGIAIGFEQIIDTFIESGKLLRLGQGSICSGNATFAVYRREDRLLLDPLIGTLIDLDPECQTLG